MKAYPIHGVEPLDDGFALKWTQAPESGRFPEGRTFADCAEDVGLHYWCDYPSEVSRKLYGWLAGSRISTLRLGNNYVHSALRWLADPLEGAEALKAFGEELQDGLLSLGVGFKGSPGSAASALFEKIARSQVNTELETNTYCEDAVYGGRNECFWTGEFPRVTQWDRSSAYVAHLHEPIPMPGSERYAPKPSLRREGISEALVSCEPFVTPYPVLPCRIMLHSGETRTVYPWGSFHGKWTHLELREAKARGYRIKILSGMEFEKLERPRDFERFANIVWKAKPHFRMAKRLGTSLIGRLHEHRSLRQVVPFGPFNLHCVAKRRHATADSERCPVCSWQHARIATGKLGDLAIPIPRANVAIVLYRKKQFSWYVNMPAASYILARARLALLRLLEANAGNVLAVCTDSAIVGGESVSGIVVGSGLGEWRKDYGPAKANIKTATAYTLVGDDGSTKLRTAGVPRMKAEQFMDGRTAEWSVRAGLLSKNKVGRKILKKARASAGFLDPGGSGAVMTPCARYAALPGGGFVNFLA